MMLKELNELYKRLIAQGKPLPQAGRSLQKLSFALVIDAQGNLIDIENIQEVQVTVKTSKKGVETRSTKTYASTRLVLGSAKPSGAGINPCFLWDNAAYLLGYVDATKTEKEKTRARLCFETSRSKHLAAESVVNTAEYSAVCRFFEKWDLDQASERVSELVTDKDILISNGLFRLHGATRDFIHECPEIARCWDSTLAQAWWGEGKRETSLGQCLITGEEATLAQLHEPVIKGVVGAQTSGAKLVSFNCSAFESYGKSQSINAPVSEDAAFGYCNALNYLLSQDDHRVRLAGGTSVFWTDAPQVEEDLYNSGLFGSVFDGSPPQSEDKELLERIRYNAQRLALGHPVSELVKDVNTRFFMLGLAPNSARLSVRYYYESTMGEMLSNIGQHYRDTKMPPRGGKFDDPAQITPFMILKETVRDSKEISSLHASALMQSILHAKPYPEVIAHSIIRRIKTDFKINYLRVAFLKAWLIRRSRTHPITKPHDMLDTTNTESGYLLGRLFAVLLKTQEEALPGLNRTIRDTSYGSASTTPRNVFPRLLKLYPHHRNKLSNRGTAILREQLITEIMDKIQGSFPQYQNVEQQGLFSIGFYHQMQAFYTKKEDKA